MTQMQESDAGTDSQAPAADHAAEHGHAPHLAHHFDTPTQQFSTGKLGMWVFLATEILMFGGLFAAYGMYRGNHPEIYLYAHHYLDTTLGAINTVILLASSFTVAWGVRAAQKGQRNLLVVMFLLTLLGGLGFMGIKAIEYGDKFRVHLGPGPSNLFYDAAQNPLFADADDPHAAQRHAIRQLEEYYGIREPAAAAANPRFTLIQNANDANDEPVGRSLIRPPGEAQPGLSEAGRADGPFDPRAVPDLTPADIDWTWEALPSTEQGRTHMFFQIYYMMTGLHAVHVIIGLGLISWVAVRAYLNHFGPAYYTPVDLVGLYWHLVDLIWIFLFPLLYLIH